MDHSVILLRLCHDYPALAQSLHNLADHIILQFDQVCFGHHWNFFVLAVGDLFVKSVANRPNFSKITSCYQLLLNI
jgi:hypothetical protein